MSRSGLSNRSRSMAGGGGGAGALGSSSSSGAGSSSHHRAGEGSMRSSERHAALVAYDLLSEPGHAPLNSRMARASFPDVYPQRDNQTEDAITKLFVTRGFVSHDDRFEINHGATHHVRQSYRFELAPELLTDRLAGSLNEILKQRRSMADISSRDAASAPINFEHAANHPDLLKKFFRALKDNTPYSDLAKMSIPYCNKKKDYLVHFFDEDVPIPRAVWLVKVFLVHLPTRFNVNSKTTPLIHQQEWTHELRLYMDECEVPAMKVIGDSESLGDMDSHPDLNRWIYLQRLSTALYEEGCLEPVEWIKHLLQKGLVVTQISYLPTAGSYLSLFLELFDGVTNCAILCQDTLLHLAKQLAVTYSAVAKDASAAESFRLQYAAYIDVLRGLLRHLVVNHSDLCISFREDMIAALYDLVTNSADVSADLTAVGQDNDSDESDDNLSLSWPEGDEHLMFALATVVNRSLQMQRYTGKFISQNQDAVLVQDAVVVEVDDVKVARTLEQCLRGRIADESPRRRMAAPTRSPRKPFDHLSRTGGGHSGLTLPNPRSSTAADARMLARRRRLSTSNRPQIAAAADKPSLIQRIGDLLFNDSSHRHWPAWIELQDGCRGGGRGGGRSGSSQSSPLHALHAALQHTADRTPDEPCLPSAANEEPSGPGGPQGVNDNYRRLCGSLAWLSTLSLPEERAAGAWFLAKVFQQQTEGSQDNDEQAQNFKNHAIIRTHVLHWVSVQLQAAGQEALAGHMSVVLQLLSQMQRNELLFPAEVLRHVQNAVPAPLAVAFTRQLLDVHHDSEYAAVRRAAVFGIGTAALNAERESEVIPTLRTAKHMAGLLGQHEPWQPIISAAQKAGLRLTLPQPAKLAQVLPLVDGSNVVHTQRNLPEGFVAPSSQPEFTDVSSPAERDGVFADFQALPLFRRLQLLDWLLAEVRHHVAQVEPDDTTLPVCLLAPQQFELTIDFVEQVGDATLAIELVQWIVTQTSFDDALFANMERRVLLPYFSVLQVHEELAVEIYCGLQEVAEERSTGGHSTAIYDLLAAMYDKVPAVKRSCAPINWSKDRDRAGQARATKSVDDILRDPSAALQAPEALVARFGGNDDLQVLAQEIVNHCVAEREDLHGSNLPSYDAYLEELISVFLAASRHNSTASSALQKYTSRFLDVETKTSPSLDAAGRMAGRLTRLLLRSVEDHVLSVADLISMLTRTAVSRDIQLAFQPDRVQVHALTTIYVVEDLLRGGHLALQSSTKLFDMASTLTKLVKHLVRSPINLPLRHRDAVYSMVGGALAAAGSSLNLLQQPGVTQFHAAQTLQAAVLRYICELPDAVESVLNEGRLHRDRLSAVYRAGLYLLVVGDKANDELRDGEWTTAALPTVLRQLCEQVQPQTIEAAKLVITFMLRERGAEISVINVQLGQNLLRCILGSSTAEAGLPESCQSAKEASRFRTQSQAALALLQRLEGSDVRGHVLSGFRSMIEQLALPSPADGLDEDLAVALAVAALPDSRLAPQEPAQLMERLLAWTVQILEKQQQQRQQSGGDKRRQQKKEQGSREWELMSRADTAAATESLSSSRLDSTATLLHVRVALKLVIALSAILKRDQSGVLVQQLVTLLGLAARLEPLLQEMTVPLLLSSLMHLLNEPDKFPDNCLSAVLDKLATFDDGQLQARCVTLFPRLALTPTTSFARISTTSAQASGGGQSEKDMAVKVMQSVGMARCTALAEAPTASTVGAVGAAAPAAPATLPQGGRADYEESFHLADGYSNVVVQHGVASRVRCISGRAAPEPWDWSLFGAAQRAAPKSVYDSVARGSIFADFVDDAPPPKTSSKDEQKEYDNVGESLDEEQSAKRAKRE